ncbi:hypothetical protein ACFWN1_31940 [Streptomyces sp. NPDC058459]|uniref:hypothetical protein n=1 Tax=Streptomyces sp. NPDC058459 TaxID=3346508 RepID=UPI00365153AB
MAVPKWAGPTGRPVPPRVTVSRWPGMAVIRIRTTPLTVVAVAAGLALAPVTPALAGTTTAAPAARPAAVSTAQGDPRDVTQRVAHFYGAYIDAVWDNEDPAAGADAKALREFYLSTPTASSSPRTSPRSGRSPTPSPAWATPPAESS